MPKVLNGTGKALGVTGGLHAVFVHKRGQRLTAVGMTSNKA